MSSKENPCCGYVLPVEKLKSHIAEEHHAQFDQYCDEDAWDELTELLMQNLPDGIAWPTSCFRLNDESNVDDEDMELNVVYAYWEDGDLFVKELTPGASRLLSTIGALPEFHSWTVWG